MVTVENKLATSVLPQIKVMQFIEQTVQKSTAVLGMKDIMGKNIYSDKHGKKFAQYLLPLLQQNRKVSISVEGITILSPYFLFGLFVYLYQNLNTDLVDDNLNFSHVRRGDNYTIEDQIRDAKVFVFHRDIYDLTARRTLEYMVETGILDEEYLDENNEVYNEEEEEF
jgi:hypothetical protein